MIFVDRKKGTRNSWRWSGMLFVFLLICPARSYTLSSEGLTDLPSLKISAIVNEQTHAIAKQVLKEAYRRIGYTLIFDDLPGKRALEWANKGITDGDVARIEGTEKKFPDLICVRPPVIYFKAVAFSKGIDRSINGWEDLKGFRIGVVRGIRYSTIGTEGMNPYFANDMTHLFTILDKGRIEVAVAVYDAGRIEIAKNFKSSGIHVIGKPLYSAPLYHFLHSRHRTLARRLENVMTEMTGTGEIDRIRRNALEHLLNNERTDPNTNE